VLIRREAAACTALMVQAAPRQGDVRPACAWLCDERAAARSLALVHGAWAYEAQLNNPAFRQVTATESRESASVPEPLCRVQRRRRVHTSVQRQAAAPERAIGGNSGIA
jgi:hypothetical protein